jgi:hypothetical protein
MGMLEARIRVQSNNTRQDILSTQDAVRCASASLSVWFLIVVPQLLRVQPGLRWWLPLPRCRQGVCPLTAVSHAV